MAGMTRTQKDIVKLNKEMKDFFKKITNSKEMRKVGKEAINIVVERTRGEMKGVPKPLGRRRKLKKVTKQYAKQREKVKNRLRSAARGLNCNLTLRGTMLNNLSILRASKSNIIIGHKGRKNQLKTEYHHANGRAYLYLARVEVRNLIEFYDKQIGKEAKKV